MTRLRASKDFSLYSNRLNVHIVLLYDSWWNPFPTFSTDTMVKLRFQSWSRKPRRADWSGNGPGQQGPAILQQGDG